MVRRMVILAVALVLATTGIAHAQYIPGQPGFTIDPDTCPTTGCDVVISGVGCPAATEVNAFVLVGGQEIFIGGGVSADDPDGSFEFGATIPPLAAGEYTVILRCGDVTLSNIITITGTSIAGPLPRTGTDVMSFVRIALVLIAVGGLLLVSERKRRRHAAT